MCFKKVISAFVFFLALIPVVALAAPKPKFGFQFTSSAPSPVEGLSTSITATVTMLRGPDPANEEDDSDDTADDRPPGGPRWFLEGVWNGTVVTTQGPQSLFNGQSFSLTYNVSDLKRTSASNANMFVVNAYKIHGKKDKRRLKQSASYVLNVIADLLPPRLTLVTSTSPRSNANFSQFNFAADEIATFSCTLDGVTTSNCTSPKTYTGLTNASHIFSLVAVDRFGNASAPKVFSWIVDTIAPVAGLSADVQSVTNKTAVQFTISANEPATFSCSLDGATGPCSVLGSYSNLASGPHVFSVTAFDLASNPSPVVSFAWIIDLVAPVVTLASNVVSPTKQTSAQFTFSSNKAASTFTCALDGGQAAPCLSPASYSGLSSASHSLIVVATDSAQNLSSPASFTWSVDTTAPQLVSLSPSPGSTVTGLTFQVLGSASEPLLSAVLNGSPLQLSTDKTSFSQSITVPGPGAITGNLVLTDLAGNSATFAAQINVVLPTPPFTLSNLSPSDGSTLQKSIVQAGGRSSRPLAAVSLNNQILVISSDGMSFQGAADITQNRARTPAGTSGASGTGTTQMPAVCNDPSLKCSSFAGGPYPGGCAPVAPTVLACGGIYAANPPGTAPSDPPCTVRGNFDICQVGLAGVPTDPSTLAKNCVISGGFVFCTVDQSPIGSQTLPPGPGTLTADCEFAVGAAVCIPTDSGGTPTGSSGSSGGSSQTQCNQIGFFCVPFSGGVAPGNCGVSADGTSWLCVSGDPTSCQISGNTCNPYSPGTNPPAGCQLISASMMVCPIGVATGGSGSSGASGGPTSQTTPYSLTWSATDQNGNTINVNSMVQLAQASGPSGGSGASGAPPRECGSSLLSCTPYTPGQPVGPSCLLDANILVCVTNPGGPSSGFPPECALPGLSCQPFTGQPLANCFVDGGALVCAGTGDGGGGHPPSLALSNLTPISGMAVNTPTIQVTGQANFTVSSASVNGVNLTVGSKTLSHG